jgi:hypothetical protein
LLTAQNTTVETTLKLHRLLNDWGEGGSVDDNSTAQNNDAT